MASHPGRAEQDPEMWWNHTVKSIKNCLLKEGIAGESVLGIGISYQMHGLVCVDRNHRVLRPSIIWCDSRAVEIGNEAFRQLGEKYCHEHLLNSPGNFTGSKLKWVKDNEPALFDRIHKVMLPGDFIAMRLTGDIVTTAAGLSEGMFWDFQKASPADNLLNLYGFDPSILANVVPTFSIQGKLQKSVATELGLKEGTPIAYRAGDQPNNAFSLNVLNPGETAATAGTSGVIYGVTDRHVFDSKSRVNTFMHVNNNREGKGEIQIRNGVLLCINGTGILYSWLRKNVKSSDVPLDYEAMNRIAKEAPIGADGLVVLPFGNGAERILENKNTGSSFHGLNFNRHDQSHVFRAAQEGIVFALKYGFDILRDIGLKSKVIRAGNANMFLSPLFREAFVNTIGARLELYDTDGAKGAALGAGIGCGVYSSFEEAFDGLKMIRAEEPDATKAEQYSLAYSSWLKYLEKQKMD
jgi:xylulokinase